MQLLPSMIGDALGFAKRPSGLAAPILAMDPPWTSADNTADFVATFDDTVVSGDDFRLQIASDSGFSSVVSDIAHTVLIGEDTANSLTLGLSALSNGTYYARCNVNTSPWSNTVMFVVAVSGRILWGTDAILWGADNITWS